jgi:hypothetical protein
MAQSTIDPDLQELEQDANEPSRLDPTRSQEIDDLNNAIRYNPSENPYPKGHPSNPETGAGAKNDSGTNTTGDGSDNPGDEDNPLNYNAGASLAKGIGAGATPATLYKAGIAALGRNKGKAGAAGLGATGLVLIGLFGTTLFLPTFTNNAQKTLGGATTASLNRVDGQMARLSRLPGGRTLFKNLRFEGNIQRLNADLQKQGYKIFDDGSLVTPEGDKLTSAADIDAEFKKYANGPLLGTRSRNKVSKTLRKRLSLSVVASAEGPIRAPKDGEDPDDVISNQAIENARKDVIDGDGTAPTSPDVVDAKKSADSGDAKKAVDEADESADELKTDGAKNADIDIVNAKPAGASDETVEGLVENLPKEVGGGPSLGTVSAFVDISDRVCTIGKTAIVAYQAGLIMKKYNLLKVFTVFLNNSDAIKTGQINGKLLNETMKTMMSGKDGSPISSSSGYQFISGNPGARPSEASKNFFGTDRQKLGGIMDTIIKLMSVSVIATACKYATNPVGQVALSVGELTVAAAGIVGTGGAGNVAITGAEQAVKYAMAKGVAKSIGKAVLFGAVTEVGMYAGQSYIKNYIGKIFSGNMISFNKDGSQGGEFAGDAGATSAGVYHETFGRSQGMRPLSKSAYIDLMGDFRNQERDRYASMSLYERFLKISPNNPDSLATLAVVGSPTSGTGVSEVAKNTLASITKFDFVKNVSTFAANAISDRAYAQDGAVPVDENGNVTDPWGNLIVGNNFSGMNPVDNYNSLEGSGEIDEAGDPVSGSGLESYVEDCAQSVDIHKDDTNDIKTKCINSQAKKYQLYLASYNYAATLDSRYNPTLDNESGGAQTTTPTGDPGQDTSNLPCPAGTEEGGVFQDYAAGRTPTVKIKICGIPGAIPASSGVNASTAANALAMINAAKSTGLNLAGSSFRSYDRQKELRVAHGCSSDSASASSCSPPTAKPGSSMHEVGLAIDFSNCSSKSSACHQWLLSNAANFGFKNLPSEPWHWSTTGG